MSYYKILGMEKEPFSTSPDPEFFFQSKEHKPVLYKTQVMLELKRGLGIIFGEVGLGKTTLMRILLSRIAGNPLYCPHIILDPTAKSEYSFLAKLGQTFSVNPGFRSSANYKNAIKDYLLRKGVEENKIVILFVDEAQKLSMSGIETLRMLLNYETNDAKLLQLILLAQMEFLPVASRVNNFWDRVALKCIVKPLDENDVKEMIAFRLKKAGYVSPYPLFSDDAINAIYQYTQGYPRRVTILCHDALEYLVMNKREMVNKNQPIQVTQSGRFKSLERRQSSTSE